MGTHAVRTGDCFASLAAHWGMTVEALLGLGDNSRHSQDGRTPHQLRPGDVIEVPDEEPNRKASFSSGGSKTYKVKIPKIAFRMRLIGRDKKPFKDKRYELVVHYKTYEGRTDDEGWVEQDIPAKAKEGELFVWLNDSDQEPWEIRLSLGGMHPHEEDSGIVHRLANLGYPLAHRGEAGLKEALRNFQQDEGLAGTGLLDADTLQRLEDRRNGVQR